MKLYKLNIRVKIYTELDRGKQDAVNRVFNGQSEFYTWPDELLQ